MIVKLQLERVKKTARGQGVELEFNETIIDRLADVGYMPEFGARELKRKIQNEIETLLAKEMLSGNIKEGNVVTVDWNEKDKKVTFNKQETKKNR